MCLLQSPTIAEASQRAGVSERTIYKWLSDDKAFNEKYREARKQALKTAIASLQNKANEAVAVLSEVMNDKDAPPSTRVSSARAVLDMAFRSFELEELEARIQKIEEFIK